MGAPRMTAGEREQLAREQLAAKRRLSTRLGGFGVAILFLGGVGTILVAEYVVGMLVLMVVGIVLLVTAFLLIRGSLANLQDLTKTL